MTAPTPPTTRAGTSIAERILVYGGSKTGKTHAFLTIARWHQRKKSPARFFFIDSDNALEYMIEPGSPFESLENIEPIDVTDLGELIKATDKVRRNADKERGDWCSIDLYDATWRWAQKEFAEKVWGKDYDDYWLDARASADGPVGSPVEGWDWGVIKGRNGRVADFARQAPCHLYAACGEREVQGTEDKAITKTFQKLGYWPEGEKHTSHIFRSIIRFSQKVKGEGFVMNTAGDRPAREVMRGVDVGDFSRTYLRDVGGWE